MDPKSELRKRILALINAIDPAERTAKSAQACARLIEHRSFQSAKTVMAFDGHPPEIDTGAVIEACSRNSRRLALPRTEKKKVHLAPHLISDVKCDLETSRFGFREPLATTPSLPLREIDLIIVPGIAFDTAGNRLGRGRGYYDRFLAQSELSAVICAVAFELQIVDEVPHLRHDKRVHLIFTEARTIEV